MHFFNYAASERLSIEARFDLLWQAMSHPDVDMVWSVRGGEGCADLIPLLEKRKGELQSLPPKILLGFSDTTALLFYWFQSLKWPAIHGPSAYQIASNRVDEKTAAQVDQLIRDTRPSVHFSCTSLNDYARQAIVKGPVFAANLTLLALAQKELWEPRSFKDAIVIVEDVGEATYRVRRALHYLRRLGYWDNMTALVIGDFFDKPISLDPERDRQERILLQEFFQSFADDLKIPVYQTVQVGHGKHNLTIQYGLNAGIEKGILSIT
jgi:muramoyltetrapeptide carboxypeptidase